MAKEELSTGQVVQKSGIYSTGTPSTPEITLSKGDRVPPVDGKAAKVTLVRPSKKGS